jgi:DNA-binding NarL/FixJ family response regulator
MLSLNVVIALQESPAAMKLVNNLRSQCRAVSVASKKEDFKQAIRQFQPQVAVVDLEVLSLSEVRELRREFPELAVICTHRLADEERWSKVIDAGAIDYCLPSDTDGILYAVRRNASMIRGQAA